MSHGVCFILLQLASLTVEKGNMLLPLQVDRVVSSYMALILATFWTNLNHKLILCLYIIFSVLIRLLAIPIVRPDI